MTRLLPLLEHAAVQALGYTLLHFIWQGALLGVLLWVALRFLRAHSPALQYGVACAVLVAMLVVPVTTWSVVMQQLSTQTAPASAENLLAGAPISDGEANTTAEVRESPAQTPPLLKPEAAASLLPFVLGVWVIGVFALMLRLAGGWGYTRLAVARGGSDPPDEWLEHFRSLARRMEIRRPVRLRMRRDDVGPCVIGWLRPVVIVPMAMLAGLPTWQMEAILAHELAHIRRHDYAVNLLQSLAETLLFYHPAVWWVSRQIRATREYCCDEEAAVVCGDGRRLARALVSLESMRMGVPALAPAAGGGSLTTRVERLLRYPSRSSGKSHVLGGSGAALAVTAALLLLLGACEKLVAPEATSEPANVEVSEEHVMTARQILAKHNDPDQPVLELFALLEAGNPHVFDIALAMYGLAKDEPLRRNVILIFPKFDTPEAADVLVRIFRNDPSTTIRVDALRALGRMGEAYHDLTIPIFRDAAVAGGNATPFRTAAVEMLARIPEQTEFLVDLLWRSAPVDRGLKNMILFEIRRDDAAMTRIMKEHPDDEFRSDAIMFLDWSAPRVALLQRLIKEDSSEKVRRLAWQRLWMRASNGEVDAARALEEIDTPEVRRFEQELRARYREWSADSEGRR